MKFLYLLFALTVGGIYASNTTQADDDSDIYFLQKLDHFNSSITNTFQQRYFVREEFWKTNGPIIMCIGGEQKLVKSEVKSFYDNIVEQLANETNGALYALEHRYYGESKPPQVVDNTEYYRHLSSRQALADLAEFIKHLRRQDRYRNSKVVVVGGSYAGSLAAWMRAKYPELVDAALASSAPLVLKTDVREYLETVRRVLREYGGESCYGRLEQFFRTIADNLATTNGTQALMEQFNICPGYNLNDTKNQYFLLVELAYPIAYYVQFSTPQSIQRICSRSHFPRLALDFTCLHLDIEHSSIMQLYTKAFLYQMCSELGFQFTTSPDELPFFNVTVDYLYDMCSDLFGDGFTSASIEASVGKTNDYYGGLELNVTRVVFTHGDMDPWARLGATPSMNSSQTPVIIFKDASHCSDLQYESSDDSEIFKKSRALIKYWIRYWLEN